MSKKTDLRVVKTKRALKKAMMDLMKKYKFEELKVKQIADEALVNRATFYYHFNDKYDLLYKILDDELNNLERFADDLVTQEELKTKPMIAILHILQYFEENSLYYKNAFETEGYESLSVYLKKRVEELLLLWVERLNLKQKPLVPPKILCNCYSTAFSYMAVDWLKTENRESPEQAYDYIRTIIEKGFFACLNV